MPRLQHRVGNARKAAADQREKRVSGPWRKRLAA